MRKLLVSIALGATFVSAPALAQGYGGFMQRDQTRAEAQQRADMMFQMLDANHDGTVTRAEAEQAMSQFQASRGDNERGGGRMQQMMDEAFAASPSLTLQQFETRALARFDAMDLNHDGIVTAAERQQARQMRAQTQPTVPAPAQPPVQPQRQ
jgi:Ca2+-binding EF-hand superfamily protein